MGEGAVCRVEVRCAGCRAARTHLMARKVDRENSGDAGSEREEERRLHARKSGLPPSRTRSLSGESWRQSIAHRRRREGRAVHPQERRKPWRDHLERGLE